jgi:hypothetical protein
MFKSKFRFKPLKPMGVSINDTLLTRILRWLGYALAVLLFSAFTTIIVVEWMVGCGETYVDAFGVRHSYSCLLLPLDRGESK